MLALTISAHVDAAGVKHTPHDNALATLGMSAPPTDVTDEQADELAALVRASGYKCDSISGVQKWVWSYGFTLVCNSLRYSYEIADKGGNWAITVK